ncbi:MAG: hypothetical protein GXP39_08030 [Chloroflexi bacterium]|nr:hypothetical protein [Chloroflexota bacterium]
MDKLHDLLREYRGTYDEMQEATADIRRAIDELNQQLAELEAPYRERLDDLTHMIEYQAKLEGITGTVKTEWATIRYRSGYTRRTWNDKMLMGYAQAHPEILAFVKETHVPPKISIVV